MAPTSSHREGRPFDVFVSHAGQEKRGVVSHVLALCNAACPEVEVFVDDWSLPPGQRAEPNILRALEECAVFVVVLSQAFVRKKWPMDEVKRIRERLGHQVNEDSVRVIWEEYDISYGELEDLVGKVYTVASPSGLMVEPGLDQQQAQEDIDWLLGCTGLRRDQDRIQAEADLVARVVDDAVEALKGVRGLQPYGSEEKHVMFGRDEDLAKLDDMREAGVFVLLYGPSGIGKTTLAMGAYEQFKPEFRSSGTAVCYWLSLRGADRSVLSLQREFMIGALGCTELEVLSHPTDKDRRAAIAARLKGKSVLLVIDDVQSEAQLAELLPIDLLQPGFLAPGSLVLVTARTAAVVQEYKQQCQTARGVAPQQLLPVVEHPVGPLPDLLDCRRLFCWHAFQSLALPSDLASLEPQLREAVRQCKQLPPVLVVTASQVGALAREEAEGGSLREAAFRSAFLDLDQVKQEVLAQLNANDRNPLEGLEGNFRVLEPPTQSLLLDVAMFCCGQPWKVVRAYAGRRLDVLKRMALVCQTWAGTASLLEMHNFVREFCELKAHSAPDGKRMVMQGTRRLLGGNHDADEALRQADAWSEGVVGLRASQFARLELPARWRAAKVVALEHRILALTDSTLQLDSSSPGAPTGKPNFVQLQCMQLQAVGPHIDWLLQQTLGSSLKVLELHDLKLTQLDAKGLCKLESLHISSGWLEKLLNLSDASSLHCLQLTNCRCLGDILQLPSSVQQLHLAACPKLPGATKEGNQEWHTVVVQDCPNSILLPGCAAFVNVLKVQGSNAARHQLPAWQLALCKSSTYFWHLMPLLQLPLNVPQAVKGSAAWRDHALSS